LRGKGAGRNCSGGATPCRRWRPRRHGPRTRTHGGEKKQRMKLGFWEEAADGDFAHPIQPDNRPMHLNGQDQPGFFRPRRHSAFPAQAQVAAWARGRQRAALGRYSANRPWAFLCSRKEKENAPGPRGVAWAAGCSCSWAARSWSGPNEQ
jgi:hypothetical protein